MTFADDVVIFAVATFFFLYAEAIREYARLKRAREGP